MSEITYESIESLASDIRQSDGLLDVTFECPLTGETVRAAAPLKPRDASDTRARDDEPFHFSAVRAVNGLVRDILGYNAAFDAATTAVDSSLDKSVKADDDAPTGEVTDEDRRDALFRAFQSVMHRFAWDSQNDRWVAIHEVRGLGNELQRQLKLAPVESKRDRKVLERMMLDVATADDELNEAEREILLGFIDREKLRDGRSSVLQKLTQADLRQTNEGQTRETLFMLALTVAFADAEFNEEESDRIEFFGKGLGISEHRQEELLEAGKRFYVEQYLVRRFAEFGELDEEARDELGTLAEEIGYDVDTAELAFERYRQAHENSGDDDGGFSFGPNW
ncbi:MAG: hypothetical protein ACQEVA_19625 [Myxococcota bacterium]